MLAGAAIYPETLRVGGNTGTVNSFVRPSDPRHFVLQADCIQTGVDLADVTGGVFDSATLFQGNNLVSTLSGLAIAALPTRARVT